MTHPRVLQWSNSISHEFEVQSIIADVMDDESLRRAFFEDDVDDNLS
jgi:hypothetical protein